MINYNYPLIGGKLIERRISEWKNAGRAEGVDEGVVKGRAEGLTAGMAKRDAEWLAWNNRRVDAERDGVRSTSRRPTTSRASPIGKGDPEE